ncbi:hypothetical protein RHGRI_030467 [Rhododendron griersonianum]|uniref:DUF241 domain protein n=1 Tax=Rhododendron griersonianum TaxID=479676 RepID=A0AAV6IND5_9ERIC|nr:hypothetical protein RHGRI_030467 [Rhododendron griersonianum]
MASFSKPRSSRYEIRSISLPSRSHPTTLRIEEELNKLKISEASSTTTKAEKICSGLLGLNEVYKCLDEVLKLPLTQKALSLDQHERWIDESLDASVRLLDVCSTARDFTSQIKERVIDLESAIRRKKGDSRIQICTAEYFSFRKEMNKGVKKLIKDVKQIDSKISSLPLLDQQLEDDHHVTAVIRVQKEVSWISMSVYNSLLLFFSPRISKPKSKNWSKLLDKGRVACEEQKGNGNELQRVDVALSNIWQCGGSSDQVGENMKMAQNGLEELEASIESIENGLECLFKGLIKARASLLNIVSL